jgi:exonuclease VII small subunit
MEITEIIRKYNLRIEAHRKGLIEMEKFNNPSKEVKYSFEQTINHLKEVVSDLEYIRNQMPTINPIEKGHYNEAPEGLKEISLKEWQRGMFLYCLYQSDSKQVRRNGQTFDLRLFDVPNFNNDKIGYAIMNDWFDNETGRNRPENIVRFCRYGTDEQWKNFENKFAAQFAGDNS